MSDRVGVVDVRRGYQINKISIVHCKLKLSNLKKDIAVENHSMDVYCILLTCLVALLLQLTTTQATPKWLQHLKARIGRNTFQHEQVSCLEIITISKVSMNIIIWSKYDIP